MPKRDLRSSFMGGSRAWQIQRHKLRGLQHWRAQEPTEAFNGASKVLMALRLWSHGFRHGHARANGTQTLRTSFKASSAPHNIWPGVVCVPMLPCFLHSSPRLLLSARRRQRTLEAYSGGDIEGKRVNILGFVVCGLCGNHTTKAPRQPSTAQPLGVVPAQILFPQANNTVEVWTCFLEGLNINIPAAMVVATLCNTSDSDLYL